MWLAASLSNYEKLARHWLSTGPKGRIVESVVKRALRGILPGRFSIGSGFAITASGHYSSQLDLVIYDGHSDYSIILEGGTGLFPIECVYAFVEVKSLLNGEEIEKFTKAVRTVRNLASEKRYVVYRERDDDKGTKSSRRNKLLATSLLGRFCLQSILIMQTSTTLRRP